jgi:predicted RNase H-like HicB family nuclease
MNEMKKDLSYYLSLPYAREILASRDGGFVASYPDLPGCAVQGEEIAATLANLDEGKELWLRAKIEDGEPIPEPPSAEPSGRLMLRVPIRLHARLDELAAAYGRSLNRFLNEILFNSANALLAGHGLGTSTRAGEHDGTGEHEQRYAYRLTPEPEGGFVAEHPDLPGCFAAGETPAEAMAELDLAREAWLEAREEGGLPVPAELSAVHTGAIHLRMPPALHLDLARNAQRNGASLNQTLTWVLAEAVGELNADHRRKRRPPAAEAWRVDGSEEAIAKAVQLLRDDPGRSLSDLPQALPEPATFFLRAIVFLERGNSLEAQREDFLAAFEYLKNAKIEGLDFETEAVALFKAMPGRLEGQRLFEKALPFVTSYNQQPPVESHSAGLGDVEHQFRHEVMCNFLAFVEGVRREPIQQKGWIAYASPRGPVAEAA